MSHTAKAKCKMKCSLDVLKRIIQQKFPEWAKHIQSSNANDLEYYNFNGQVESNDNALIIPGVMRSKSKGISAAPGVGYCDIGFHLSDDGTWESQLDPMELQYGKYKNLMQQIEGSIAEEKGKEFIQAGIIPGLSIQSREESDDEITFKIGGTIDVENVEKVGRRMNLI